MLLQLAQEMPDSKLLQGDAQDVMAWIVLLLVVLLFTSNGVLWRKLGKTEDKLDKSHDRTTRIAIRSTRAIEVLADLQPSEIEEELDEDS